MTTKAIQK